MGDQEPAPRSADNDAKFGREGSALSHPDEDAGRGNDYERDGRDEHNGREERGEGNGPRDGEHREDDRNQRGTGDHRGTPDDQQSNTRERDPPVGEGVRTTYDEAPKIFVGGLTADTTNEMLLEAYSKFGEITDYFVLRHRSTGLSRGFGFVTFKDVAAMESALKSEVEIDGRKVENRKAEKQGFRNRGNYSRGAETQNNGFKIFVGGLTPDTTDEEFADHFKKYGDIESANIMRYSDGGSRKFGFVKFKDEAGYSSALRANDHSINRKQIECKPAIAQSNMPRGSHPRHGS